MLGHTECGAVKGACDKVELGHLSEVTLFAIAKLVGRGEGPTTTRPQIRVKCNSNLEVRAVSFEVLAFSIAAPIGGDPSPLF